MLNTYVRLQISLLMRFLTLLHQASWCAFGDGVCWLLIQQFFNLFAQFKTTTKSHENCLFLYPFSSMAISPQINEKNVFYTSKLYGLTGMCLYDFQTFFFFLTNGTRHCGKNCSMHIILFHSCQQDSQCFIVMVCWNLVKGDSETFAFASFKSNQNKLT